MRAPLPHLLCIVAAFTTARTARAEELVVPDQYATIQAAIDAAAAGDTVLVRAGVYTGRVTLNKSHVKLVGEPGATLHDEAPGGGSPVVRLGSPAGGGYFPRPATLVEGAEVRGLRIESAFANVIGVFGTKNCRITQVTIVQTLLTGIGIHSFNEGLEVDHCTFIGAGIGNGINLAPYGLFFGTGQEPAYNLDLSLHHNDFSGLGTGISLLNVRGGSVTHNQITGGAIGISVAAVLDVDVAHNDCTDATQTGIAVNNATRVTFTHNHLVGCAVGFTLRPTDPFFAGKGYPASSQDLISHNTFVEIAGDDVSPDPAPEGYELSKNRTDAGRE